jgi:hypothetical protein
MSITKPLIGVTDDALTHRSETCTQRFVPKNVLINKKFETVTYSL